MEQEYETPRVRTMRRLLAKVLITLSLAAVPFGLAAAPALADATTPAASPAVVAVAPVHHHHGHCHCLQRDQQGNMHWMCHHHHHHHHQR
ncbi:MAG: hypothetical protein FWE39_02150 [Nocardiaceae bacterium]|nr:hypothetical protein [Nocardiaceae bacterium]